MIAERLPVRAPKPISKGTATEILTRSPEETRRVGAALGTHAHAGAVILLMGELGSGKTCLTQGILAGLGSKESARSPTFVLATQYPGRLTLYHLDLYRLERVAEMEDIGLDEYLFGDGVCVVEWAEKALPLFPEERLEVHLERTGETERRLTLSAHGPRHTVLLKAVIETVRATGRSPLRGD
jgi:tRNA threonylcarbamoyladenosine biosynthesis protein TsaE